MKFTEENLNSYAQPLSESEQKKCENAINMLVNVFKKEGYTGMLIKRDISNSGAYYSKASKETLEIKLFVQWSYANNTNVRQNSDVDIAVVLESTFTPKYRNNEQEKKYEFWEGTTNVKNFKDEIELILKKYFGKYVERKNKSIKINGNSYRVDTDSVPCQRYRDYTDDYKYNINNFIGGIRIKPDNGISIINYPEQHIINGKEKNKNTNYLYKKMVRIIKKMRYLMIEDGIIDKDLVNSFLLESLLWNISNLFYIHYKNNRKVFIFYKLINWLIDNQDQFSTFKEANGIKQLCSDEDQLAKLKLFLAELKTFYEYE